MHRQCQGFRSARLESCSSQTDEHFGHLTGKTKRCHLCEQKKSVELLDIRCVDDVNSTFNQRFCNVARMERKATWRSPTTASIPDCISGPRSWETESHLLPSFLLLFTQNHQRKEPMHQSWRVIERNVKSLVSPWCRILPR